jgi:hypothetical protein
LKKKGLSEKSRKNIRYHPDGHAERGDGCRG